MVNKIFSNKHFQSLVDHGLTSGIAVLSFMILARYFTKDQFGQWALYLTLITFLEMTKFGVVKTALIKFTSGNVSEGVREEYVGSSWVLNLGITAIYTLFLFSLYSLNYFKLEGIVLVLVWYPLFSISNMPFNYYLWLNHAKLKFNRITKIRGFHSFLFLLVTILCAIKSLSLSDLVVCHLLVNVVVSLFVAIAGNIGLSNINRVTRSRLVEFYHFGKYHILAFFGSNLLKSSDVYLIGYFLGPVFIAIYSIPLRLVELIESPLKSAVAVAFPVLSGAHNKHDNDCFKLTLEKYIGVLTVLYVPFMLVLLFFSNELVYILGGNQYQDSVDVFRIFLFYGLLLPFDRLTGISLDAINLPKMNFYKVFIMASVNVVGNTIALYFFKSLELVAFVTVLNVLAGAVLGYYFLKKELGLNLRNIFSSGIITIQEFIINNISVNKLKSMYYEN
jgi:O-antigen/teichoic acid export membrane protein